VSLIKSIVQMVVIVAVRLAGRKLRRFHDTYGR
jgi:hypothetical protein